MSARISDLASHSAQDAEDALAAGGHARRRPASPRRCAASRRCRLRRRRPTRSTPRCGSGSTASRCCRRWPTWPAGWSTSTTCARCRAAAAPAGAERAHLDLVWAGQAMSTETVMSWEIEPMRVGADATPLTRARRGRAPRRRVLVRARARAPRGVLPLPAAAGRRAGSSSRPRSSCTATAGPSTTTSTCSRPRRRRARSTTARWPSWPTPCSTPRPPGSNPSDGDEIIQIGATRIVNGKLLRQECFEQLVDPQRADSRGVDPDPRHPARRWWPASRRSPRCCRPSTPSRRTPCWWRTTPPSTCASCS